MGKLNTFTFMFFTLFGTNTRAYRSLIALQHPSNLSTQTVNGLKKLHYSLYQQVLV